MATLYVNSATGDDSRSKATAANPATPWDTIGRAAWGNASRGSPNGSEAAAAGDVVMVAAGTYDYSASVINNRFTPLYNPVNSGTDGNRIRFIADGTVDLTASAIQSPIIGASGVDFIEWSGPFNMSEDDILIEPDTGLVVLHTTEGCLLDGLFIDGGEIPSGLNDNHNGVRFEFAVNCIVRNCTIHDIYSADGIDDNHGSIFNFYTGSQGNLVENNYAYNFGCAISYKDKNVGIDPVNTISGNIVRYNYFQDMAHGMLFSFVSEDENLGDLTYQNIFANLNRDGMFGINLLNDPREDGAVVDEDVFNNVFYNFTWAVVRINSVDDMTGVRLFNNIFWGDTVGTGGIGRQMLVEGTTMPTLASGAISVQHNCYHLYAAGAFCTDSAGNHDFADYKSDYGQDQIDVDSIDDDPEFVNVATGDFHLGGSSPALVIGYAINGVGGPDGTTIPAGAYITGDETIGIDLAEVEATGAFPALVAIL